jgi:hypothetical protein
MSRGKRPPASAASQIIEGSNGKALLCGGPSPRSANWEALLTHTPKRPRSAPVSAEGS